MILLEIKGYICFPQGENFENDWLNDQNKVPVANHAGPHPKVCHQIVYRTINEAVTIATRSMREGSS